MQTHAHRVKFKNASKYEDIQNKQNEGLVKIL